MDDLKNPKKHGLNSTVELAMIYESIGRREDAIQLLEKAIPTIKDHTKSDTLWFSYEYAVTYLCRLYRTSGRMEHCAAALAKIAAKPRIPAEEREDDFKATLKEFPVAYSEAEGKNQRWAIGSIAWSLMALYFYDQIREAAWPQTETFDASETERQIDAFNQLLHAKIGK